MSYRLRYLTVIINVNSLYLVVVPLHFYFGSKYMYSAIRYDAMQYNKKFSVIEYEVI